MRDIAEALHKVNDRIERACVRAGRARAGVQLLAVSKSFAPASIALAAAAGQLEFGESYAQEFLRKREAAVELAGHALHWHFIGPVQSNKSAALAASSDWVHSIERLKIAERLSSQRPPEMPPLNLCVQVNISGEASKSGCTPVEARELCAAIVTLPNLRLRGLMAIPAASDAPEDSRGAFQALRRLLESIHATIPGQHFDTLSMGMSDDLEIAIEEGATIVRVGSAIFGERLA